MKERPTPVILLTARDAVMDKDSGLDAGADDYLSKPFSVGALPARIRTTERHLSYMVREMPRESVFENGDLRIDFVTGVVSLAGKDLHLTPREYKLLCLLARNVGRVLTHQFILREAWGGGQEGDLASLRVYMGNLRKKIGTSYIQTHVGVGYRMVRV